MRVRTLGYTAAAGIAAFLVVFVAVSELLLPFIEFSVLVGLPAGIGAGVLVAAVVLIQFGRNADGTPHPLALSLGTFGVTFLTVLAVALVLLRAGVAGSIVIATGVGLIGGLVGGLRARGEKPPAG
ncbi:hypothetical protein C488_10076 [Natrinema pellirubrum DSM 15624]|uniref:DUF8147 domain-containing protein n=1 Tax=Natrinema pellirubrum (strain DSM 15624 / CIP 106293 / JCM 10476 / NCIMB 786 / 157) TaxID=797303 RepID=L0JP19_NATP1|nr:hypothetical protein [Natrinema pellirubrum]AGB32989.1 hypothetical protein Natpe_3199 [Natrinema pellirubrum DSM 15624]ELY75093.1 hypothetical protein C488_10076 [Natrinema pellirubrum DSM 15624]